MKSDISWREALKGLHEKEIEHVVANGIYTKPQKKDVLFFLLDEKEYPAKRVARAAWKYANPDINVNWNSAGGTKELENTFRSLGYKTIRKQRLPYVHEYVNVNKIESDLEGLKGSERIALQKMRVNQSAFRDILLETYGKCHLCKVNDPDLLIASHIKPWSKSNASEKVNGYNGLLLCPGHDRLFDRFLISFDVEGKILINDSLSTDTLKAMNVKRSMRIDIPSQMEPFMRYHRKEFYRQCQL